MHPPSATVATIAILRHFVFLIRVSFTVVLPPQSLNLLIQSNKIIIVVLIAPFFLSCVRGVLQPPGYAAFFLT
jgi:hypothetical protein